MTHPLLDRLAAGPILADGAIGTMLYAAGASLDESFDALNLSRPDLVVGVHRAYLDAGAELLETNSFGANRCKLEGFGLRRPRARDQPQGGAAGAGGARDRRQAGAGGGIGRSPGADAGALRRPLAGGGAGCLPRADRGAAGGRGRSPRPGDDRQPGRDHGGGVGGAGCLRPAGGRLDDLRRGRAHYRWRRAARGGGALAGAGRHRHWRQLLGRARSACCPWWRRWCAAWKRKRGRFRPSPACRTPGWPPHVAGRFLYPSSPEYFAEFAAPRRGGGVRIVGGCCGTTPLHTRAMRAALDDWATGTAREAQPGAEVRACSSRRREPICTAGRGTDETAARS